MTSLAFNSGIYDGLVGAIDYDDDTFYAMLVTSSYTPDKTGHTKRSDVTNEVTGTGYAAGGQSVDVTVTNDTGDSRVVITVGQVVWTTATVTARGLVVYKHRGGASSADNLVCYIDFGSNIASTNADFTADASDVRINN